MDELHEQAEIMIEAALNEYPLTPLPPHFVAEIMARVARLPQWRPEPFRVGWRDLLLPGVTAVFIYLLLSLNLWLFGRDVAWLPDMPTLLSFDLNSFTTIGWFSIATMVLLGEVGLLLLLGMGLWWDRPFAITGDQ